jgi:tellurite resistance protein TehA-like permease
MQDILNVLFSIFIACLFCTVIRYIHAKQNNICVEKDVTFNRFIKAILILASIIIVGQSYEINNNAHKILQILESLKTN